MTLTRRASGLRASVTPPPTAHAEGEQHESGHQPAGGGFQFRIGENVLVRQDVEPSERGAREE